ncbi:secretion-regulating guanine nucleotide exchange factor-like [Moniliophthora roreri MCA 2997]|uniref:Secretion-regulating guanine nucleotide exchange factor-like n=1 Tax=Moniliophthora roreri (strain MCA 2997) TaxID=1381753 RepID=V2XQ45_MONRO|nr:secretion-regulating guanine nucleotide exchange factor-like [Moniliophthora roreri MCA 2997]
MSLTLLASGSNAHGQLANGTTEDSHLFAPCIFSDNLALKRIIQIASGANHTLLLAEIEEANGGVQTRLYGCGDGSLGQLGNLRGSEGDESTDDLVFQPIHLPLEEQVMKEYHPKMISASWQTTYIVFSCSGKPDRLISMGSNDFGDLGVGASPPKSSPFHVVHFDHVEIDGVPMDLDYLVIDSIATGQHHVLVQLRVRLLDSTFRDIVVGWGTCRHGELDPRNANAPISGVGKGRSKKTPAFLSVPTVIPVDSLEDKIVSVALGNQHTVFLGQSGRVYSLGSNRRGQRAGLNELVKFVDNIGCTWNGTYLVVHDTEAEQRGTWSVLATGSHHKGQLGRKELPLNAEDVQLGPVAFPMDDIPRTIRSIACGSEHVLALFNSRDSDRAEVWGWGWNEHGNLGVGTTDDIGIPVRVWPFTENVETARQSKVVDIWAGCGTSWIAIQN